MCPIVLLQAIFYHPQTKFAKVMFSQVSVCPQGEGGFCPRGRGLCLGGFYLGESLSRRPLSMEYLHTTIGWGCLLGRPPGQRYPRTVKRGRYASYWNVFLFSRIF